VTQTRHKPAAAILSRSESSLTRHEFLVQVVAARVRPDNDQAGRRVVCERPQRDGRQRDAHARSVINITPGMDSLRRARNLDARYGAVTAKLPVASKNPAAAPRA
jgi:hypothetical protein